jgi:hypothetical protein
VRECITPRMFDLISYGTSKRDEPFGCFVGRQVREAVGQGLWDQPGFYFFPFHVPVRVSGTDTVGIAAAVCFYD